MPLACTTMSWSMKSPSCDGDGSGDEGTGSGMYRGEWRRLRRIRKHGMAMTIALLWTTSQYHANANESAAQSEQANSHPETTILGGNDPAGISHLD
jgi:hypothetical protein